MIGKVLTVASRRTFLGVAVVVLAMAMAAGMVACAGAAPAPATPKPADAPTRAPEPTKPAAAPTKASEPTKPAAQPTAAPAAKKVDYPEKGKAISVIVPFAAGSALDIGTRALTADLEKELGAPMQIVNREGAGMQVGLTELAMAKPDGYTLSSVTLPSFIGTYLDSDRKAAYNRDSFQPVAGFTVDPYVVVVQSNGPFKTVKDVVDAAKASPGKIKIGIGGGKLSMVHLTVLMFQRAAGADFSLVMMDSGANSATGLLGGHVDVAVSSGAAYMAGVKAGNLSIVGVMDQQESKFLPGVKTVASQGYDVRGGIAYQAMVSPTGTPKEIVDLLSGAVKKTMDTSQFKERIDKLSLSAQYKSSAELAAAWAQWEADMKPLVALAKQQ